MLYGMLTDVGEAVAFDPGGSVYIIGWFTGKTITIFGAASEKTSTGGTSDADLFVAKLGP
jgi:hypothetical protein